MDNPQPEAFLRLASLANLALEDWLIPNLFAINRMLQYTGRV
jgi:hypothetical protein